MTAVAANCPGCQRPLPGEHCNTAELAPCPFCFAVMQVEVFPALFRSAGVGPSAEPVLEAGVSSCFYHDQKKAVVPCDACGRFLCALCDVEMDGKHVCPGCLDAGRRKGKMPHLENQRPLLDNAALTLSLLPLGPVSFLTAPAALVLAVLSFRRPLSLVRRTRVRAWLAIFFAFGQIGLWSWWLFFNS